MIDLKIELIQTKMELAQANGMICHMQMQLHAVELAGLEAEKAAANNKTDALAETFGIK